MKINELSDTTTTVSNIDNGYQDSVMGIDPAMQSFAASMLSNIYNNPIQAVIREYFTNGLDAHISAGVDKPVVIQYSPYDGNLLRFTDEGVGMTRDDIINIFGNYFTSTKRDGNTEHGAFGLGSKSGFAISDQYTVTSVKDGMISRVICMKTGGQMIVRTVQHEKTHKANGTSITIPVSSDYPTYRVNDEIKKFFSGIDENLYHLDFPANVEVHDVSDVIDGDDFTIELLDDFETSTSSDHIRVFIGAIPYFVPFSELKSFIPILEHSGSSGFSGVSIRVPIGSLSIAPNREGVLWDNKSVSYLTKVFNHLYETIVPGSVDGDNEKITEHILKSSGHSRMRIIQLMQGYKLTSDQVSVGDIMSYRAVQNISYFLNDSGEAKYFRKRYYDVTLESLSVISNYDLMNSHTVIENVGNSSDRRLRSVVRFMSGENNTSSKLFIALKGSIDDLTFDEDDQKFKMFYVGNELVHSKEAFDISSQLFIDGLKSKNRVEFEDINEQLKEHNRANRVTSPRSKVNLTYHTSDGWMSTSEINDSDYSAVSVYDYNGSRGDDETRISESVFEWVDKYVTDPTLLIVFVGASRKADTFVSKIDKPVIKFHKAIRKFVPNEHKISHVKSYHAGRVFRSIREHLVDYILDPKLVKAYNEYNVLTYLSEEMRKFQFIYRGLNYKRVIDLDEKYSKLLDSYAFTERYNGLDGKDYINYLNGMYLLKRSKTNDPLH